MRCFDSITEAYSDDFAETYITERILEAYKKTNIYINHYNEYMQAEKKNYVVFEIMKYQVIDTSKKNEILSQIHLLDEIDEIATYMALISNKVVKIYTFGGMQMYFTDRKTNRKSKCYGGLEFLEFEKNEKKYNQEYDEVFISVFEYFINADKKQKFFIEHNKLLNEKDIKIIGDLNFEMIK